MRHWCTHVYVQVCEEYKLHRETYYLAKDMLDRFMDQRTGVLKDQLQLIGVTCLFIASKIEVCVVCACSGWEGGSNGRVTIIVNILQEIYPPKVGDFAYVTDGACSVANIIETELVICKVSVKILYTIQASIFMRLSCDLQTLKWRLNHNLVTVNTWVNMYMQLHSHHMRPAGLSLDREFELPSFSTLEFTKIMQLLDLCTLDMNSRQFGASVIAASALYLASERSRPHLPSITGVCVCVRVRVCVCGRHTCDYTSSLQGLSSVISRSV